MSAPDHHAVLAALDRLTTWMRRHRPQATMSATSLTTLDRLSYAGPARISDLAAQEGVTQPAMTALVNRLESDGLARRSADPSDGRASLVTVTDAGRDAVADYRRARVSLLAERLDALDGGDLAALHDALPAIDRLTAGDAASHTTDAAPNLTAAAPNTTEESRSAR